SLLSNYSVLFRKSYSHARALFHLSTLSYLIPSFPIFISLNQTFTLMNAKSDIPVYLAPQSDQRDQDDKNKDGGIRRRFSFDPAALPPLQGSTLSSSSAFSTNNSTDSFSMFASQRLMQGARGGRAGHVGQEQYRRQSLGDLSFIVRGVGRTDLHNSSNNNDNDDDDDHNDGRDHEQHEQHEFDVNCGNNVSATDDRNKKKEYDGVADAVDANVDLVPCIRHDSSADSDTETDAAWAVIFAVPAAAVTANDHSLLLLPTLSSLTLAINTAITFTNPSSSSTITNTTNAVDPSTMLAPVWDNTIATRDSVPSSLSRLQDQQHPLSYYQQTLPPFPFSRSSSSSPSHRHLHLSEYQQPQQQQKRDDINSNNNGHASPMHTSPAQDNIPVGLSRDDAGSINSHSRGSTPTGTILLPPLPRDVLSPSSSSSSTTTTTATMVGSQAKTVEGGAAGALPPLPTSEQNARRTQQSSVESFSSSSVR
ncbi:MAG: hypothetical protein J3R72DRAFT_503839, partial [Linnemannia gamsii]